MSVIELMKYLQQTEVRDALLSALITLLKPTNHKLKILQGMTSRPVPQEPDTLMGGVGGVSKCASNSSASNQIHYLSIIYNDFCERHQINTEIRVLLELNTTFCLHYGMEQSPDPDLSLNVPADPVMAKMNGSLSLFIQQAAAARALR